MQKLSYGFGVEVDAPFHMARELTIGALRDQGFGIVSEINVSEILREKLGVETAPYTILGACNPDLAARALELDPDIGLLLPCNVVVRQDGGFCWITAIDPVLLSNVSGIAGLEEIVASDARQPAVRAGTRSRRVHRVGTGNARTGG
jgi:uncharacterized protein (DUF302 family)